MYSVDKHYVVILSIYVIQRFSFSKILIDFPFIYVVHCDPVGGDSAFLCKFYSNRCVSMQNGSFPPLSMVTNASINSISDQSVCLFYFSLNNAL